MSNMLTLVLVQVEIKWLKDRILNVDPTQLDIDHALMSHFTIQLTMWFILQ